MRCPKCNNNVYSHHQKINKSGTEISGDFLWADTKDCMIEREE